MYWWWNHSAEFDGEVAGSGNNILELAADNGTIEGIGTGSFNYFQDMGVDSGASWTLTGNNTEPIDDGDVVLNYDSSPGILQVMA